jgi:pimeloyl-ACP methyl ester carboxylesterase
VKLRPFTIQISDEAIAALRLRLQNIRWPSSLDTESWEDGASLPFMKRLAEYWRDRFDWRAQEQRLNRLPHHVATIDGMDIHFVHQQGAGEDRIPLVLTHGWPGSFIEMERLIPLLTDPSAHGADPSDAFDVVVPSLPGYGFSPAPTRPGVSSREIAMLWRELMAGLGYNQFAAQGGDIGAGVSMWLARLFPADVLGIHLNYVPGSFRPSLDEHSAAVTPEEQAFLDRSAAWAAEEGAYAALHATRPQTLAFPLSDSPIGLAAWIIEKFRAWSDCGGDVEQAISLDTLLTDISLYWFSDSLTASLRLYKENRARPLAFAPGERVAPPLGMALFPFELPTPPQSWVARVFDVRHWNPMPSGGHFAALERPEMLATDIRNFFRPLRAAPHYQQRRP